MIKKASLTDVDDMVKLWQELMDYHLYLGTEQKLKKNAQKIFKKWLIKNIKSKDSIVLIAKDKKPIGYLLGYVKKEPIVYVEDKMGYISDGYIIKGYRKKGIMKKMVKEAKSFFRKRKMKHIGLRADTLNKKGVISWNKIGFEEKAKEMYMRI